MQISSANDTGGLAVVTVEPGSDSPSVEAVIALFERIADEEGWLHAGELRAHAGRSVYFALRDGTGEAARTVGGLQLVLPDGSGSLPCRRVWPEVKFAGTGGIAHIAVMAVDRRRRGSAAGSIPTFWLLAVEMWRYCVQAGISEVWLEATPRVHSLYLRLGFPLTIRGELREHWSENCYLASMTSREVAGALAEKAVRSEAYRLILARAFRFTLDGAAQ